LGCDTKASFTNLTLEGEDDALKEDLSNFFSKSNFYFESVWNFLGKELLPRFGSCPRRKGKIGP
jgi:hypothetical protein